MLPPIRFFLGLCVAGFSAGALVAKAAADSGEERAKMQFFESEIRPLLVKRCYECHGEKKQKAGLRLDHISHALTGGDGGPALVPGKPAESMLIKAIGYKDEDLQMPPKEELPAEEKALLEKWVALGAPWPAGEAAVAKRDRQDFTAEERAYWFFQPLAKPTPPALKGNRWVVNDVDRFVAAKHAELGLTPSPAADRAELARRVYFDLHGLPPTAEQLTAFVNDRDPQAYEHLVETLLASPRYGERWAQHWLDLVRYAESDGYRADGYRSGAWPYRDWVIKSLNADKPYNEFVREQLAGDEIAPENPDVLIATSYLRNPVYEWNQRDVRGQAELIIDDMTGNAGEVFLGLSMACARCHDHKFDPILQKDYFALRAFFEPVLWRTDLKLATPAEQKAHDEKAAAWEQATAEIRAQMEALVGPAREKAVKRAHDRFTEDIQAMMAQRPGARAPLDHVLATIAERQLQHERDTFDPLKSLKAPADKARYQALEVELRKFDTIRPKALPAAFVATDVGPVAPVTRMKSRKGERAVAPGFVTLIDPREPKITALPNSTGRRTALADWIVRPDNPLSTRVIANRVWHYHFGRGIAGTPNDLGHLGERPTHPELLDWLTQRFVAGGWSLKKLHREIMLSATYQQTARRALDGQAALVDPNNKYLWRFSPRRLDAEQVRDAMLVASGELDLTAGGPSQEANTSPRRSIYTMKKRNSQNELLRSLDLPAGFSSIADRQITSTPIQALLFMNGEWPLTRARKLAAKTANVDVAWKSTLGRAPAPDEAALAEKFVEKRLDGAPRPLSVRGEPAVVAAEVPGRFHENTARERLLVRGAPKEGDDFTVEATIVVESVDSGAAVRVIASRWTGEKGSLDGHGWSLGVTGKKSGYKPLNLIMQLVGEDENMNTAYEVVPSGLFLTLRTPYHVVAKVSSSDSTVTFQVRDLSEPAGERRAATARHGIHGKLSVGQATPVIGGMYRRGANQFDGQIDALRIVPGLLADETLAAEFGKWSPATGVVWDARRPNSKMFEAQAGVANAESADPFARAMADLCHVLLNSNEFIYLH
jgi:cytochrome c553